ALFALVDARRAVVDGGGRHVLGRHLEAVEGRALLADTPARRRPFVRLDLVDGAAERATETVELAVEPGELRHAVLVFEAAAAEHVLDALGRRDRVIALADQPLRRLRVD